MSQTTSSFDLTATPWLRVRTRDHQVDEVSLRAAFERAHEVAGLAGDVPTQAVALLRLMLAILRASHPDARSQTDWAEMWSEGRFDLNAAIGPYLDQHRERFDLLHPSTPFYQVAGLRTGKDQLSEVSRLIPDVPPGHQYFTTRAGRALKSLSYAEAARWVVHTMCFDPSGIKSGAVGDDRVRGGKGYPIGVAWAGWLGVVVLEGSTLFETLLLNWQLGLHLPDATVDRPAWERDPVGPGIEAGHAHPTGPADLLTWQSRRLRLGHDGERVTGVLVANGDPLHPRNQFFEYMTSWRFSEAQQEATKSADPVYMPRVPMPDRAVWRGLEPLLARTDPETRTRSGTWLEWLAALQLDGDLAERQPVRLRVVAAQYGAQSSVIDDITDDALLLPVAVLTSPQLREAAIAAVQDVDAAASLLAQLAGDLARAAGADRELSGHARSDAREQAYAAVDALYRQWVAGLVPGVTPDRGSWQQTVRSTALRLGREVLDSASPAAWAGLPASEDRKQPLNAATAANWFYRGLAAALPDARPQAPRGGAA